MICNICGVEHGGWCPLKPEPRYNPFSDEEKMHRDLNKVRFGVVADPNALHPAARREWELQRFESRWRRNPEGEYCSNCDCEDCLAETSRREAEEADAEEYLTIEPLDEEAGGGYAVYQHGVYEEGSVLAGQSRRSFIEKFDTAEEAEAEYPTAQRTGSTKTPFVFPDAPPSDFSPLDAGETWSDPDDIEFRRNPYWY